MEQENGAPNPLDLLIGEMKARTPEKREITVFGKTFWQYPTVFDSEFTEQGAVFSTTQVLKLIAEEMANSSDAQQFDFLEIGCGTGLTSTMAALYSSKCQVFATDVNPQAVENAAVNAKLHGVSGQVKTAVGDVFCTPKIAGKKFDMIFWSHPFIPFTGAPDLDSNEAELGFLVRGLVDPGYSGLREFLCGIKAFLKDLSSKVLMVFSFKIGSEEMFRRVLAETGWNFEVVARSEVELKFTIQPMAMKTELVFLELFAN